MASSDESTPYVVTGKVTGSHGLGGWVKIEILSTNLSRFTPGGTFILEGREAEERLALEEVKARSETVLVKFVGVDDRERAEALKGLRLLVTADELGEPPEGALWEHQVLGMRVETTGGVLLGKVVEILETGANDVLIVKGEREYLIPAIKQVVVDVDLEVRRMMIKPMPGMLEG